MVIWNPLAGALCQAGSEQKGTWRGVCSISPGSCQPHRGRGGSARVPQTSHKPRQTSHKTLPEKQELPRTTGRGWWRGGTAAEHEKPELRRGSSARSAGEGGSAGTVRARPGLGAGRRPGPTSCPSYLASSGSVKSRTGASAGGLKRSSGSALAAGGSRSSRQGSGSSSRHGGGPRAAAPAMAGIAHRPRPAAREGSGVGPQLRERRGEGSRNSLGFTTVLEKEQPPRTALKGMGGGGGSGCGKGGSGELMALQAWREAAAKCGSAASHGYSGEDKGK